MEKPTLRVLVALPMVADVFTDPVCCSLEFYYDELRGLGIVSSAPIRTFRDRAGDVRTVDAASDETPLV
jgi:hypothetical protein